MMIDWQILLIVFLPIYILLLILNLKIKLLGIKYLFWWSLLYFYVLGIIAVTFFPLPIQKELLIDLKSDNYLSNNYIPFNSIIDISSHPYINVIIRQIGGNILLLLPLGFLLPILNKKLQYFSNIWLWGLLVTISIELLQLTISVMLGFIYKIFDIDDIILNFVGFTVGFLLWKLFDTSRRVP